MVALLRESLLVGCALAATTVACGTPPRAVPVPGAAGEPSAEVQATPSVSASPPVRPRTALAIATDEAVVALCESSSALAAWTKTPTHAVALGAQGQLYALALLDGDTTSQPYAQVLELTRLDRHGEWVWTRRLGRIDGYRPAPWPILVTPDGDILLAGSFEGVIEQGNIRLGSPLPTTPSEPTPALMRISPDGTLRWARALGRKKPALITGLAVAKDGTAYVAVTTARAGLWESYETVDGAAVLHAVDSAGRVSVMHRFAGRLRSMTMLPGRGLVLAGDRSEDRPAAPQDEHDGGPPAATAFLSLLSLQGKVIDTLDLAAPTETLALAATGAGDLWIALDAAAAAALHIEVEPLTADDPLYRAYESMPQRVIAKLSNVWQQPVTAVWLIPSCGVLFPTESGELLPLCNDVPRAMELGSDGLQQILLRPLWENGPFDQLITADGQLRPTPKLTVHGEYMGSVDIVTVATWDRSAPTVRTCLRPCDHLCRVRGWCHHLEGECVPLTHGECAQSERCRSHGRCSMKAAECHATQARHCRDSTQCRAIGACVLGPSLHAHPVFEEDARGHLREITFQRCVVGSDRDCQKSTACRQRGLCKYTPEFGAVDDYYGPHCRPGADQHCRLAEVCREQGRCHVSADGLACEARTTPKGKRK